VSLLTVAYYKGYYGIAELLIKRGAEVNARTSCGSLLSRACAIGHKAIIYLLIRNGAKINYPIKIDQDILQSIRGLVNLGISHYSPLYYAVLRGHKTIVEVLFKHGTKTHISSSKGNIAQLKRKI
jgi:ankyrin repeat protein